MFSVELCPVLNHTFTQVQLLLHTVYPSSAAALTVLKRVCTKSPINGFMDYIFPWRLLTLGGKYTLTPELYFEDNPLKVMDIQYITFETQP